MTGDLEGVHVRWGWWLIALYVLAGLALEALHALKLELYLHPAHEVRRLLWTLAHTHGTLLGLLHLAFAATLRWGYVRPGALCGAASWGLRLAGLLMPLGFVLGGATHHGGDPGLGVLLVPVGGVALAVSVTCCATAASQSRPSAE